MDSNNYDVELLDWIRESLKLKLSPRLKVNMKHIPRVRFGAQNDKCLIVVYTGIGKFVRVEFVKDGQKKKITVKKQQDTLDPSKTDVRTTSSDDHFSAALSILNELIGSAGTVVEVLEWDLYDKKHTETIMKHLGGCRFHVKKVVFLQDGDERYGKELLKCVDAATLVNGVELTVVAIGSPNELIAEKLLRTTIFADVPPPPGTTNLAVYYGTNVLRFNTILLEPADMTKAEKSLHNRVEGNPQEMRTFVAADSSNLKKRFDSLRASAQVIQVNEKVTCHRIVRDGVVMRFNRSPCGYWLDAMTPQLEKHIEKTVLQSTVCNIGIFCKNCMDPFEYVYHRDLHHRAALEKGWDASVDRDESFAYSGTQFIECLEAELKAGKTFNYFDQQTDEEKKYHAAIKAKDLLPEEPPSKVRWMRTIMDVHAKWMRVAEADHPDSKIDTKADDFSLFSGLFQPM